MEEDYDEDYPEDEEEESSGMMLSIGEDGKASIEMQSDYIQVREKDMDLIQGFIKENQTKFNEYVDKNKPKEDKTSEKKEMAK